MRPLALVLAFAAFAGLALVHVVRLPALEGPDEPGNLEMVRFVVLERRLPRPAAEPTAELEALGRGLNPPLWFVALAPLHARWFEEGWYATPALNPEFKRRGGESALHHRHGRDEAAPVGPAISALRKLRATSIAWAVVLLLATAWTARSAGAPPWVAAGLVALAPGFQHASATLSMDACVGALGSLALACACAWIAGRGSGAPASGAPGRVPAGAPDGVPGREGASASSGAADGDSHGGGARRRRGAAVAAAFGAGAFAGLAALAKLSGLVLVPCLALAAAVAWRRGRGGWRAVLACALGWAVTAGPYHAWGWLESGHVLWPWAYQRSSPLHLAGGAMTGDPWNDWALGFAGMLLLTWAGNFGWTAAWVPFPAALLLGAAYGAGAVAFAARGRFAADSPPGPRAAARYLVAVAVIALAAEAYFNAHFFQPQARHLLPFAPALAVPLARGLRRLRIAALVLAFQLALSVYAADLVLAELRPEGWNADPLFAATSAGREARAGADAPNEGRTSATGGAPTPRWLAPAEGEPLTSPRLAWTVHPGHAAYEVLLAVENPGFSHRPWRGLRVHRASVDLDDAARASLARGELTLPAGFWAALAPGVEVRAQVLALDRDGRVVGRAPPRRFTRGP